MSEASMLFQPRMLEPSKPSPSEKESSFNSATGMLKCCQVPKVSTNLMSTIFAPAFLASSNTLLGVLMFFMFVVLCYNPATVMVAGLCLVLLDFNLSRFLGKDCGPAKFGAP
jgi:hypothetical protein